MEGDFISINKHLLPLSWLYGLGVGFRNMLFDMGILKSQSYAMPVISIGNITVGGTGKTPHVEYLINLLKDKMNVAMLSRGYKRKTSGFVLATPDTDSRQIGDEPYQIYRKFPNVTVAVDAKRTRGISKLIEGEAGRDIDAIILDDAFQHRYVEPGINIMLVDYHRLIIYDTLLPAGRLREPIKAKNRADIVIITKCPHDLKPMDFRVLTKAMNLYPYQQLYFSTHEYDPLVPVFPDEASGDDLSDLDNEQAFKNNHVLLLTGIASPKQMQVDLEPYAKSIHSLTFADHHRFKAKDIAHINETFASLPSPKFIITTEKDATRLHDAEGLSDEVRRHLYALPIHVRFMLDQQEDFDQYIIGYILKNSKNSILVTDKMEPKTTSTAQKKEKPFTISFNDDSK